ncbi:uncharacterized protein JCM15063_002474 [Sporobolomyces koalae]|uniref:uncharacterized protein n=1 Tax=Sporobolomyces koalae TaxID=500713 RepID=UPI003176B011
MPKQYSGSLQSLRRPELLQLVSDLGIDVGHNRYLSKYDLVELCRSQLKRDKDQRNDPHFSGIWRHMPESQMDEHELERIVDEHGAVEDPVIQAGSAHVGSQSPRARSSEAPSSSRSASESAQNGDDQEPSMMPSMRDAMLHPHIFDTLRQASPRKAVSAAVETATEAFDHFDPQDVGPLALVPASRSLTRKASRSLSLASKRSSHHLRVVARGSVAAVAEAQYRLSSSWFIIVAILVAEYSWIVYEALPWAEYSIAPYPSLILPHVPPMSLHFPAVHLLLHPFFTFGLIRYSFQTLVIPFVLATIFAFPSSSASDSRRHSRRRLAAPSPLVFALSRLALALLKGFILQRPIDPTATLSSLASSSRLAFETTLRQLVQEAAQTSYETSPGLTSWFAQRGWTTGGWKEVVGGIAGSGHGERRWNVEEIIESGTGGVWGVVALGMGVASVVSAVNVRQH